MAQKDEIFIATDSAVAEIKGVSYTIIKGKRYAGNHPVVKHAPTLFESGSAFDHDESATRTTMETAK